MLLFELNSIKQNSIMGLKVFEKKSGVDSQEVEAPDGGWGWIVAIGVAALFVSSDYLFSNFNTQPV